VPATGDPAADDLPELVATPASPPRTSRAQSLDALVSIAADLIEARALLDPEPTAEQRARWSDAAEQIVAALGSRPRGGYPPKRWRQLLDDTRGFVEAGWISRAHALGWDMLELIGCDRDAPFARYDHAGLAFLLNGGKVLGLTNKVAVIEAPSGGRLTHRRVPLDRERVVLLDQIKVER
jgi:hypothetical protein